MPMACTSTYHPRSISSWVGPELYSCSSMDTDAAVFGQWSVVASQLCDPRTSCQPTMLRFSKCRHRVYADGVFSNLQCLDISCTSPSRQVAGAVPAQILLIGTEGSWRTPHADACISLSRRSEIWLKWLSTSWDRCDSGHGWNGETAWWDLTQQTT